MTLFPELETALHAPIPSKDWMHQGAHALCSCGVSRCSVLIASGALNPICTICGWGFDPDTMLHDRPADCPKQPDHRPERVA